MTIKPERPPAAAGDTAAAPMSATPAAGVSDEELLAQLGYKPELDRALGLFSSFAVQFSSIAVASSMVTQMIIGLQAFGPASWWVFLIAGALQVGLIGVAIAQLVSAFPLSGGVYQIVTRLTGKTWLGWQTGWQIILAHTVAVTAIATSLAPYVAKLFGMELASPVQAIPWVLGLIALATFVNLVGVRVAAFVNNAGVVAEIVAIILILGALVVIQHPWQPVAFLNTTDGTAISDGWVKGLVLAVVLPVFTISSFDSSGNASEETTDAARKVPIGLCLANSSAWLVGTLFMGLLMLSIDDLPTVMGSDTPVAVILDSAVGHTISTIFQTLAIIALFACMCVLQLTGARVTWAQARDGQLPFAATLRKVDSRRIPVFATLVVAALSLLYGLYSQALVVLGALTALGWALAYLVGASSGLVALMRGRLPASPFNCGRATWPVFIGAVAWSVILCVIIVYTDPVKVGGGMIAAIAVGFAVYFSVPSARRGKVVGVGGTASTSEQ